MDRLADITARLAAHNQRVREVVESYNATSFSEGELITLDLTPPHLVQDYLYRDLSVFAAPGGASKTTLSLWECVHIALGRTSS